MTIKYVSLNMWVGGALMEPLIAFLRAHDPDIVALQEVYNSGDLAHEARYRSIQILQQQLPGLRTHHFAPAFLDNRDIGNVAQGNAVFSRWPIVRGTTVFYDRPYDDHYIENPENYPFTPRNLQHVTINAGGVELNVFNTQGIWGHDGDDNQRRLKMADTILQATTGHSNVILSGDFNMADTTQSVGKLEQRFTSVFAGKLTTSFNMRRKSGGGFASSVVDMVFVDPGLRVVAAECPDVDISDHLPQVVTLEVAGLGPDEPVLSHRLQQEEQGFPATS